MELRRCCAAYSSRSSSAALDFSNLRDSREVLGDSNRKSPLCDRWGLFSFSRAAKMGGMVGPGASLILPLPLPDAQEVIVSAAFMPGWHRADRGPAPNVPGLPGYSLHSSLAPSLPSVPPSAFFSFFFLHLAMRPRLHGLEGGSPFSVGHEVRGTFPE